MHSGSWSIHKCHLAGYFYQDCYHDRGRDVCCNVRSIARCSWENQEQGCCWQLSDTFAQRGIHVDSLPRRVSRVLERVWSVSDASKLRWVDRNQCQLRYTDGGSCHVKSRCCCGQIYTKCFSVQRLFILGSGSLQSEEAIRVSLSNNRSWKTSQICGISACSNLFHVVFEPNADYQAREGCADGRKCDLIASSHGLRGLKSI